MSSRDFLVPASPTLTFTYDQKHTLTFFFMGSGDPTYIHVLSRQKLYPLRYFPSPTKMLWQKISSTGNWTSHHHTSKNLMFFFSSLFGLFYPLKIENGGECVLPLVLGSLINNRWYLLDSNFTNHLPYLTTKSLFYFNDYSPYSKWVNC